MEDPPDGSEELFEGSSDDPITERSPDLRAGIYVLAPIPARRASIVEVLPEKIEVESFSTVRAFADALSGNVAVVLLSAELSDEQLRTVASETVRTTNYTRIGLLIDDRDRVTDVRVPHDELFFRSSDRQTFQNRIKRLYVRAHYDATLQRYYALNLATQNRKQQLDEAQAATDDRLEKLTEATALLESHLARFRQYLQPGDLDAILERSERVEAMLTEGQRNQDPTVFGLPRGCPKCGLAWDEWHGSDLESGYEKIGADTWRCTRCSNVIAGDDPDNYRIS